MHSFLKKCAKKEGPSLGKANVKVPHPRRPNAMIFEDWSQEMTGRQQRCARGKAWNHGTKLLQAQRKRQGWILTLSEDWVLPGCVSKSGRGKRVCCWFKSEYAYGQQERPWLCWVGDHEDIEESDDGQQRGANQRRSDGIMSSSWTNSPLLCFKQYPQCLLEKLCEEHGWPTQDQWSTKTTSHQRWRENWLQYVEPCANRSHWFISEVLNDANTYFSIIFITGFHIWCQQIHRKYSTRSGRMSEELRGDPLHEPT